MSQSVPGPLRRPSPLKSPAEPVKKRPVGALPVSPQELDRVPPYDISAQIRGSGDTGEMDVQEVVRQMDPPGLLAKKEDNKRPVIHLGDTDLAHRWIEELGLKRLSSREHTRLRKGLNQLLTILRECFLRIFSRGKLQSQVIDRGLTEFFKQCSTLRVGLDQLEVDRLLLHLRDELQELFSQHLKDKDESQVRNVLSAFEMSAKRLVGSIDPKSEEMPIFVESTSCMLEALHLATQPPFFEVKEHFLFDTIAPQLACNRYVFSSEAQEAVREAKWKEPILEGELVFEAINLVEHDIFRDSAWVNGHRCRTLGELVSQLVAVGVPGDKVGEMVTLFSQNTLNGINGFWISRFQSLSTTALGYKNLVYNSEDQTFSFQAHLLIRDRNMDPALKPLLIIEESPYAHLCSGSWELKGQFQEGQPTACDSHFQLRRLLSSGAPHEVDESMASMRDLSEKLNARMGALSPYEKSALSDYDKRLRKPLDPLIEQLEVINRYEIEERAIEGKLIAIPGVKKASLTGEILMPQDVPDGDYLKVKRLFEDYQAKRKKGALLRKAFQQAVDQAYPKQLKAQTSFEAVRDFLERKKVELAEFEKFRREIKRLEIRDLNAPQSQAKLEEARAFLAKLPLQV